MNELPLSFIGGMYGPPQRNWIEGRYHEFEAPRLTLAPDAAIVLCAPGGPQGRFFFTALEGMPFALLPRQSPYRAEWSSLDLPSVRHLRRQRWPLVS
jgi:hypothetical protein